MLVGLPENVTLHLVFNIDFPLFLPFLRLSRSLYVCNPCYELTKLAPRDMVRAQIERLGNSHPVLRMFILVLCPLSEYPMVFVK